MTEKNTKATRDTIDEVERLRANWAAGTLRAREARDPFEDPELDALLARQVDSKVEARLIIADHLLTRVRFRREV